MIQRRPGAWALGVVLGCAVLYALWTALRRHQPRRPILLVINLYDFPVEQGIDLLANVHLLLCEPAETRLLRGWRRPAPLIVLVLADGCELSRNASKTRGESFLPKIFDHTELVPAPTADQVQTYDDRVAGTSAFTEEHFKLLMPDPQLIKQFANIFEMLLAVKQELGHHEDDDTVACAAALFVRFPTLVYDLRSAPEPPVLDPPTDASPTHPVSPWLRREVQQVLRRADGSRVDITRIARCYGKHYSPDPASPLD